jgi:hypothetical protein
MFFPPWSSEAKKSNNANQNSSNDKPLFKTHVRESLSNVLLTYIDFRRPMLGHKVLNSTKEDEAIEKIPESCIEEFNLYVSTWKGWQGPLPGKDNKITWEQVERENTIQGTVSCSHIIKESTNHFDDLYGNETNSSTTEPPIIIAESFR